MTRSRSKAGSDSLSERLKGWDPASRERLQPDQVETLRARVRIALAEASVEPEGRLAWGLSPRLLAAAGVLIVALMTVWMLGDQMPGEQMPGDRSAESGTQQAAGRAERSSEVASSAASSVASSAAFESLPTDPIAPVAAPELVVETPTPVLTAQQEPKVSTAVLTGTSSREDVTPGPRQAAIGPAVESEAGAETRSRRPRRVAFRARGGTQILWTLDPDFSPDFGTPGDV